MEKQKPDDMDQFLMQVVEGLTPEMVADKSLELEKEFEQFTAEYAGCLGGDELTEDERSTLYKSWVGHKLATFELTITHILGVLQALEEE